LQCCPLFFCRLISVFITISLCLFARSSQMLCQNGSKIHLYLFSSFFCLFIIRISQSFFTNLSICISFWFLSYFLSFLSSWIVLRIKEWSQQTASLFRTFFVCLTKKDILETKFWN
jgi:hypothetical protein